MTDYKFLFPAFGPGRWADLGEAILQEDLVRPTMAHVASMFHDIFFDYGQLPTNFKEFASKLKKVAGLWAYTGTLNVPSKGVYVQDYPEVKNGRPSMTESELVKKLKEHDKNVRFVSLGFKTGFMSPSELSKNPYIKALAGEEGAERLAKVASKTKLGAYKLASFVAPPAIDQTQSLTGICSVISFLGVDLWLNTRFMDNKYSSYYAIAVER